MVNSGAIATTSLTPGSSTDEKWDFIREGLSRFAGRELVLDDEIFASATATNFRNQAIADLMQSYGALGDGCRRGRRPVHAAMLTAG